MINSWYLIPFCYAMRVCLAYPIIHNFDLSTRKLLAIE
jgi:hypothetical protein